MAARVQVTNPLTGKAPRTQRLGGIGQTYAPVEIPGVAQNNSVADLAQALGSLGGSLQRGFEQDLQVLDDKDIKEGEAAFLKNQTGFKDAVKQGLIPAGASPHFRRGVDQAHLKSLADEFGSALKFAHANSGVANTDDAEVLNGFISEFSQEFMKENLGEFDDVDISQFYADRAAGHMAALHQQHTAKRVADFEKKSVDLVGIQTNQLIDAFQDSDDDEVEPLGQALGDLIDPNNPSSNVFNGMNQSVANDALFDAAITRSLEEDSLEYLDALRTIKTPGGYLVDINRYRAKIVAAETTIGTRSRQQTLFEQSQAKLRVEASKDAAVNTGYSLLDVAMESNDFAKFEEHAKVLTVQGLGKEAEALRKVKESRLDANHKVREEPGVVSWLYNKVLEEPNKARSIILEAEVSGIIQGSTAQSLQKFTQISRDSEGAMTSKRVRDSERSISKIIVTDENADEATQATAYKALEVFRDDLLDWLSANRDKDGKVPNSIPRSELRRMRNEALQDVGISQEALNVLQGPSPKKSLPPEPAKLLFSPVQPATAVSGTPSPNNPFNAPGMVEEEDEFDPQVIPGLNF